MILVTMREIVNSVGILKKIGQCNLKATAAFKVSKLLKEVDKELSSFRDARQKIMEKYCEKDENGNIKYLGDDPQIKEGYVADYNTEATELLDMNVEMLVEPIRLSDIENVSLTPIELMSIENLIQE